MQFLCNGLQSSSVAMGCKYTAMQFHAVPHLAILHVHSCKWDAAMQFLCNGLEEDFAVKRHAAGDAGSELDLLVQSSGKMLLLHKLLPKLKAEGHKVLTLLINL
jgi:hypothetical protein